MTPEEFDKHLDARPFVPFTVHLSEGQGFYVPTRGFVAHKPDLWSFIVYNLEDAGYRIVNFKQVTTITVEEQTAEAG